MDHTIENGEVILNLADVGHQAKLVEYGPYGKNWRSSYTPDLECI